MKFDLRAVVTLGSGVRSAIGARLRVGGKNQKANRSTRITVDRFDGTEGIGGDWSSSRYGEYYATSAAVYAAVRTRADAVGRPPLLVEKLRSIGASDGEPAWQQVDRTHPLQQLVDRPNNSWSQAELVRAIESNLLLWGGAFLGIEKDEKLE